MPAYGAGSDLAPGAFSVAHARVVPGPAPQGEESADWAEPGGWLYSHHPVELLERADRRWFRWGRWPNRLLPSFRKLAREVLSAPPEAVGRPLMEFAARHGYLSKPRTVRLDAGATVLAEPIRLWLHELQDCSALSASWDALQRFEAAPTDQDRELLAASLVMAPADAADEAPVPVWVSNATTGSLYLHRHSPSLPYDHDLNLGGIDLVLPNLRLRLAGVEAPRTDAALSRIAGEAIATALTVKLRGRTDMAVNNSPERQVEFVVTELRAATYLQFAAEFGGRRGITRSCRICGRPFVAKRKDRLYCSRPCVERAAYQRRLRKEARNG